MANASDKFTEPLVAELIEGEPEQVGDTRARLEGLITDAKARNDTYLVELYGEKLAALPQE